MKSRSILLMIIILSVFFSFGQNRKILLEEFSGAKCGNCPMGDYISDSLSSKYPDVIVVSLHAYKPADSMDFPTIDTLYNAYSAGAPMATVDRVSFGGTYVAQSFFQWDGMIQQRQGIAANLSVDISSLTWDPVTRQISAHTNFEILSSMPNGDYRIGLYIVEDSVVGSGPGYDQVNFYNSSIGNPFYGMGDPIIGYIHKHVARALLPSAWGLTGVIPVSPVVGQIYSHTFNYNLPSAFNETKISLIAFVYKYTSDHLGDEVLNATELKLNTVIGTGLSQVETGKGIRIYPNPFNDIINIDVEENKFKNLSLKIINHKGMEIEKIKITTSLKYNSKNLQQGVYYFIIEDEFNQTGAYKLLKLK